MSHANFIHLRVHTAYSLAEGAVKINELIKLCQDMNMPAVAMTDTGNLFGGLEFSIYCAEAGIQPIIGIQLQIRHEDKDVKWIGYSHEQQLVSSDQLVLLVQNEVGYSNLLKLISKAFLNIDKNEIPQVSLIDLELHNDGLIALSGGPLGIIGRLLGEGRIDRAKIILNRLNVAFSNRFYIELQRHGLPIEEMIEPYLINFADHYDIPLVATNEPFFIDSGMYEAHDALLCIAGGNFVSQNDRRRVTPNHYFKSAEEMQKLFYDLPEAINNTLMIAKRCVFLLEKKKPLFPSFPTKGMTEVEMLRKMSIEGLERRLETHIYLPEMSSNEREQIKKPYYERMNNELNIIIQMGFPGYFLIVADFIQWSKANGVPVGPGRGSGAGSIVAWALTITDLNPLRWGLLFERFLNPERISMPDFDIDFCHENREKTIRYVQHKYGYNNVAQIITFGKLQARAVLRDVGRVLQMPYDQIDHICKLVPNNPADQMILSDAIEGEPLLKKMQQKDEQIAHLFDICMKLEGLYRHASTHAAGIVIGDRPLNELVPLYLDNKSDMPVTQFNMKWIEFTSLIKFDFLSLKTLTVIYRCVEIIKKNTGIEIDMSTIPLDDKRTYEMLSNGETVGVFQLESLGMSDVLCKMHADRFEDIIAVVALYRPGPMDNISYYISVKHKKESPDYLHPCLEKILKETHGIMIYQEQVMQIAQELSGYTLGDADLLRRAIGKKIQIEMDFQRKIFVDGAISRCVDKNIASEIFDQISKFAGYGFNKSHAAAYALIAYQTAWLKANYPVAFMAASMTCDIDNTDKLSGFRQELDRLKIKLLPPDINKSGQDFLMESIGIEDWAVRYALAALKNIGTTAMKSIVIERDVHGIFLDIEDFIRRVDLKNINKRQMENLVRAGVFDSLNSNRAQVFEGIEMILHESQIIAGDRESGQPWLFNDTFTSIKLKLPNKSEWTTLEKLQNEFEAIGFYLLAHPMDAYKDSLSRIGVLNSNELMYHLLSGGKNRVKLAGIVNDKQERISNRGSKYAFLNMSDSTGMFKVIIFNNLLMSTQDPLTFDKPLLITVDASIENKRLQLIGKKIENFDLKITKAVTGIKIFIRNAISLDSVKLLLTKKKQGRDYIILVIQTEKHEVDIRLNGGFVLSKTIMSDIKMLPNVVKVQEL
ncbi:MAG: DNA polymerase III subunit alpha [Rhodospirillaceae bacterium]|jgi:DNA polymerase-3 subunit alpha|nr:DNA polymerase III subunit alpha [Rhodospirillaceae bacterium]